MKFAFAHNNFNVTNLEQSIAFYQEALGLEIMRTKEAEDGSWKLVFLGHEGCGCQLELTWYADRKEPDRKSVV